MAWQQEELTTPFPYETLVEQIPCDHLVSNEVCAGYAYWQCLRGARRFPARDEIRPRDIASILRHMVLTRVLDDGGDFLLKIVGDEVARAYRAPLINRRFSEIALDLPNTTARWSKLYRQVAETGEPLAVRVVVGQEAPEINFTQAETICLPFGPADDCVDHLVTVGKRWAYNGPFRIPHI